MGIRNIEAFRDRATIIVCQIGIMHYGNCFGLIIYDMYESGWQLFVGELSNYRVNKLVYKNLSGQEME